jgi:hypothetical protein
LPGPRRPGRAARWNFDGWLALLRVISELLAGEVEAAGKPTKGNGTGRFGGD